VHLDGAGADGAAPVSSRPAAVAKLFLHGPSPRFEGGDDRGIRRARLNRDRDHAHARNALASARSMLGGWIAPWQDGKRARRAPPANVPGASAGDRRQQRLGWSIMLAVSPVADGNLRVPCGCQPSLRVLPAEVRSTLERCALGELWVRLNGASSRPRFAHPLGSSVPDFCTLKEGVTRGPQGRINGSDSRVPSGSAPKRDGRAFRAIIPYP